MLNVQALQSTLSAMSLPQIQQYASLHKDDPYVVAMALSVANTKKQLQTAQQGAAGQQPQPKVVDQDIAEIAAPQQAAALPEEQGIGQLPAPNMQGMAGGGIVAFDEGGEVPRYQDQGLIRYPYGTAGGAPTGMYDIPGMVMGQPFTTANNPDLAARIAQIEALPDNRFSRATKDSMIVQAKQQAGAATTQSPLTSPTQLPPAGSPKVPPSTVVPAAQQAAQQTAQQKPPPADQKQPGINPNLPSGQGVGAGIAPLAAAGKWYESQLPDKEVAQTEEEYAKKREAVYGPLNEKVQNMIDEERKKLSNDKEENFYMALVEGGLAAAAGTSPYALQNIASGFGQGAKSYGQGLKDLRLAAKEVSKMDMDQQKAIAAQKIGNMDAYEKYSEKVADRNSKIDQLKASGLASLSSAAVSGQYSLEAAREHASAYKAQAAAYREAQIEQRDQAQVEAMRKNIYAEVIQDPRFKVNAAAANAEVQRRLQEQLKNFPRLAQYATLPTTGGATGATTGSTTGWGQPTIVKPAG